jgi:hypothetical protein
MGGTAGHDSDVTPGNVEQFFVLAAHQVHDCLRLARRCDVVSGSDDGQKTGAYPAEIN